MSKEKTMQAGGGFFHELFQVGLYKRAQGRVARQVTFAVIAVTIALAAWSMLNKEPFTYGEWFQGSLYLFPGLLLFAGIWVGYRVVNLPKFADFLIAVEAEMNKVSWPSRVELIRSSIVVIFVIFAMALILFGYDIAWQFLFQKMGILYNKPDTGS